MTNPSNLLNFRRRKLLTGIAAAVVLTWLGWPQYFSQWVGVVHAQEQMPPLKLTLDKSQVELELGRLVVRLSRPAAKVTLKVIGQSGAVVAQVEKVFSGIQAGQDLVVHWPVREGDPVARIEVFGYDTSGYYKGVAITPWSFDVPHQEVRFDTGSAAIRPPEEKKLKRSLATVSKMLTQHGKLGAITLFIVAHTDTVGGVEYNRKLSTRRAQAIAQWFRHHGLKLPIAFDGLGESALKIRTQDEVPEARNRRVDYFLALEPPRFKMSTLQPHWRQL